MNNEEIYQKQKKQEKKVNEAARIIKQYCFEKGDRCFHCMFLKNKCCSLTNTSPELWNLED